MLTFASMYVIITRYTYILHLFINIYIYYIQLVLETHICYVILDRYTYMLETHTVCIILVSDMCTILFW